VVVSLVVILGLGLETLPLYSMAVQMGQKFKDHKELEGIESHFRSLPRPDISEVGTSSSWDAVFHSKLLLMIIFFVLRSSLGYGSERHCKRHRIFWGPKCVGGLEVSFSSLAPALPLGGCL
jgi:hypothetical protein